MWAVARRCVVGVDFCRWVRDGKGRLRGREEEEQVDDWMLKQAGRGVPRR